MLGVLKVLLPAKGVRYVCRGVRSRSAAADDRVSGVFGGAFGDEDLVVAFASIDPNAGGQRASSSIFRATFGLISNAASNEKPLGEADERISSLVQAWCRDEGLCAPAPRGNVGGMGEDVGEEEESTNAGVLNAPLDMAAF